MSKSILLADDSPTIRRVVELSFSDTEFRVECVSNGTDALARLAELRPDIALVDVVMPGPTGYELCRRIKHSDRPIPVLLLAGTFEAFDHELARSCGADGCLMKPFESRTLLDRVASLLAERSAMIESAIEPLAALPDVRPEPPPAPEPAAVAVSVPVEADERPPAGLAQADLDAIAREVVRRLSDEIVREVAREVVPRIAEAAVRERIRELESEDS